MYTINAFCLHYLRNKIRLLFCFFLRFGLFVADSIGWDSIVSVYVCVITKHPRPGPTAYYCDEMNGILIFFILKHFEIILAFYPLYLTLMCAQLVNSEHSIEYTHWIDSRSQYVCAHPNTISNGFPVM